MVRKTAAHFLSILVDKMGPGRVLSGVKDVTDKILPTAAQFLTDGAPDTRYSACTTPQNAFKAFVVTVQAINLNNYLI